MAWRAMMIALIAAACSPEPSMPGGSGDARPGDGGATDGSTVDAVSITEACAQLATDRCTKLMTCSQADLERRFGDLGTCKTREALACEGSQSVPNTAATPANAIACGAALAASACADFLGKAPPAACAIPAGPGAGGCAFGAQCSTSFCAVGDFALCGQCRAVPQPGTSCAASGCGPTLICADATKLCQVPGKQGSQCNRTIPCGNGFSCVGATQQNNGQCQAEIATLGAACDPNHNNRAGCNADLGLTCNANTNKCVTMPRVAAGKPCGTINGVFNFCLAGAVCKIPQNQQSGTCQAPAADAAACNITNGPDCFFPARCIPTGAGPAGTCQFPGSAACF